MVAMVIVIAMVMVIMLVTYLIFVTGATGGARVNFFGRCKFLHI